MDIYHYLNADHNRVSKLMEQVAVSNSPSERESLFFIIKRELSLHSETEAATFYRAVREATRDEEALEKMNHAEREHEVIHGLLEELSSMPVEGGEWIETFRKFRKAVIHHVEEEETKIFKAARQCLTDGEAKQLVIQMDEMKRNNHKSAA